MKVYVDLSLRAVLAFGNSVNISSLQRDETFRNFIHCSEGNDSNLFCLLNQSTFHMAEGLLSVELDMSILVQKEMFAESHEG